MPFGPELSRRTVITGNWNTATNATGRMTGDVLDMTGFDGVLFVGVYGTTNAGTESYIFAQGGTASGSLSDTTGAQRLSKTTVFLDLYRPTTRFVRGGLVSTASGETKTLIAIQYGPRTVPTTQPASTTGVRVYSPGTGTATG